MDEGKEQAVDSGEKHGVKPPGKRSPLVPVMGTIIKDRLQFRLHFAKETSNNNRRVDGVGYKLPDIVLKVYMTPN